MDEDYYAYLLSLMKPVLNQKKNAQSSYAFGTNWKRNRPWWLSIFFFFFEQNCVAILHIYIVASQLFHSDYIVTVQLVT